MYLIRIDHTVKSSQNDVKKKVIRFTWKTKGVLERPLVLKRVDSLLSKESIERDVSLSRKEFIYQSVSGLRYTTVVGTRDVYFHTQNTKKISVIEDTSTYLVILVWPSWLEKKKSQSLPSTFMFVLSQSRYFEVE